MVALLKRNDVLEGYSRRDILILTGIPATAADIAGADTNSSSLLIKVVDICNAGMNLQLKPEDISSAHRLPRRKNDDALISSANSTAPFVTQYSRQSVN